VATNNGNEEIEDSDEECVVTAERNFKWRTRTPKDHFEKILEATSPHHPYPVKHNLRDCSMMKKFMSLGAPPGGDDSTRDSRCSGMVEVASITD
jgi:hypothetical protein